MNTVLCARSFAVGMGSWDACRLDFGISYPLAYSNPLGTSAIEAQGVAINSKKLKVLADWSTNAHVHAVYQARLGLGLRELT